MAEVSERLDICTKTLYHWRSHYRINLNRLKLQMNS
ncbi:hypothetical protein [Colwellia sp. MB02u-6]